MEFLLGMFIAGGAYYAYSQSKENEMRVRKGLRAKSLMFQFFKGGFIVTFMFFLILIALFYSVILFT